MHDIADVNDVRKLVESFYKKVLQDELIGPIFNKIIKESEWPKHLEIMVNFWRTNILFQKAYEGNPMKVHIAVDAKAEGKLSQAHFDRWLKLWRETIDENFTGENAETTKKRAGDMAKLMLYKIESARS